MPVGGDGVPAALGLDEDGGLVLAEHERHPAYPSSDPCAVQDGRRATGAQLDPDLARGGVVEAEQLVAVLG